jgi:acetolactate synthase-1/2/3 large subunit
VKLSDYVAEFLADQGIGHVFVMTGGAAAHLIDSIARNPRIDYVCPLHEQAAAMAADAYSRVTGNLGAAIVTTGPGVTNLLTGVCSSYYDSVPALFISGQVATFRLKKDSGVRQLGFQEMDHVAVMTPVTKYSVLVEDPKRIRYELEKAVYLARSGRPGPAHVDIPDNLQRVEIDPRELEPFAPPNETKDFSKLRAQVEECIELVQAAKRPVLVLGAAVKLAKAQAQARRLAETLNFPVALTWATMDMFAADHPLNIGGFGVSSTRRGNFAIQNADLIFSIGSRLDSHATGSPVNSFARAAKKIIVDIDRSELDKFARQGMSADLLIRADARDFLDHLMRRSERLATRDISEWRRKIQEWRIKFPVCRPEYRRQRHQVNPYVFLDALSDETCGDEIIFADTGANVVQTFQGYRVKEGQRLVSAFNNTPMGYALPASVGACFAAEKQRIVCLTGDGGLQVNIQELGTIARHRLPIKIFVFNNHGFGIIQQTQDDWLDSRYWASRPETGLPDPDYLKIAKAYGLKTVNLPNHKKLRANIKKALAMEGPVLCNIDISPEQRIVPMLQFGRPIEDPNPRLDRKEFLDNMIVEPMEASLHP